MTFTQPSRLGFLAGVLAGAAAGLVMLAGRIATGVPSLPEVVAESLIALVPLAVFDAILAALTFAARPLLLTGVVVGYLILSGGLGALYDRLAAKVPNALLEHFALAAGLALAALLAVALALLLLGRSILGSADGNPLAALLPILLGALTFAVVLPLAADVAAGQMAGQAAGQGTEPGRSGALESRRAFLRALAGGSVLVVVLAGAGRAGSLLAASAAKRTQAAEEPLPPEITPNSDFYVVSKNFGGDPLVDSATWSLQVGGLVERPYSLTYDELRALPSVDEVVTLECISNVVGGDLMGNARWKGVRLADLLARAGVKPEARKVVFYGADGYEDSIWIDRALSAANLLAYEMNGETLPVPHGFPARLLVPGIYGMKNLKWIQRISMVDYDYQGYWQRLGWSDDATIKTMSRIDRPVSSSTFLSKVAMSIKAGGVAFAGDRGISRVEISLDEGTTWREAVLRPALSQYAWAIWTTDLTLDPGTHRIFVRATDGQGELQDARNTPPLPDGATGQHWVVVRIEPS